MKIVIGTITLIISPTEVSDLYHVCKFAENCASDDAPIKCKANYFAGLLRSFDKNVLVQKDANDANL